MLKLCDSLEDGFSGNISVKFDIKDTSATKFPLFLDFQGKLVRNVFINEEPASGLTFDRHRIMLPQ